MSRATMISAALLVGLVATAGAQETPAGCCSHDHPCRLGLTGVGKCQLCHPHYPAEDAREPILPTWQFQAARFQLSAPPSDYRSADPVLLHTHTRICLACHDGVFGPLAERCRFYSLAVRLSQSTTGTADCGTCHDPHLDNRFDTNDRFLHHRERCGDCHIGELYAEADRLKVSVTGR